MNLAASIQPTANPIDQIENFLSSHAYALERRSTNEIVVEIQGKWNDMLVFFSFEENMSCLHISCLMNIEIEIENKSKIFELLALINDNLWVGHFSYWPEHRMPVFRHSVFYNEQNPRFDTQVAKMFDSAVKECERM